MASTGRDARDRIPHDDAAPGQPALRVLMLNYEYPPVGGGAGVATAALAAALVDRGARVDVLTSHPGRSAPALDSAHPALVVHRVQCRRTALHQAGMLDAASYVAAAIPAVRRLLREARYDIAHLFFSLPTGLLLPLFRMQGVPAVVSLRGSDVPGYDPCNAGLQRAHAMLRPVTRWIWRRADRVVALSHDLGRLACETEPSLRYSVIPNGVDLERFRRGDRAPSADAPVRCIAVARLVERKGLQELLQAFALLERGRYQLEIVGSGPAESALRELTARLGLETLVRFTGALDHAGVAERLRAADLFTLPSRSESFGNVFAEAMASGLPIVGTTVGGIPEFVQDGEHGTLVAPRDPVALAAAIARLGDSPALRGAMAARNRAHAEAHLGWEAVTRRYLAVYAEARRVPVPGALRSPLAVAP
jgi:glycosyltransferase involved in cell wall biosynthesis